MDVSKPIAIQPLIVGMRRLLYVASGLVFIVGVQLFVLSEATARFFAWTIDLPLTAAFLGGAYWASCVLEFSAAREAHWARARVAVPAVLTFTTLTMVVTILHLDRFHLQPTQPLETQFLAWMWVAVYAAVPPIMLIMLLAQWRTAGVDPLIEIPIPIWLRNVLGLHAAILVALGVMLFLVPQLALTLWPWKLTLLTARAIGAWLLGLGVAAAHAVVEIDWARIRHAFLSYTLFGVLQIIALVRYADSFNWNTVAGWLYLIFIASMIGVGAYGWWYGRAKSRPQATNH